MNIYRYTCKIIAYFIRNAIGKTFAAIITEVGNFRNLFHPPGNFYFACILNPFKKKKDLSRQRQNPCRNDVSGTRSVGNFRRRCVYTRHFFFSHNPYLPVRPSVALNPSHVRCTRARVPSSTQPHQRCHKHRPHDVELMRPRGIYEYNST